MTVALTASRANAALPEPVRDRTVDALRLVRWDPPLPIPGLSPAARYYISHPQPGRGVQGVQRFYLERAARLADFVGSDDFRELIGARPGVDGIESDRLDPSLPDARFHQTYRGAAVPADMMDGSVTLHLSPDGIAIEGLSSTFEGGFEPNPELVAAEDAVAAALGAALELRLPITEASDVVKLLALRERSSQPTVRDWIPRDLLLYNVILYDPNAPALRRVRVLVDAAVAEPYDMHVLGGDADLPSGDYSVEIPDFVRFVSPYILCNQAEGSGLDVGGSSRAFSTSYVSAQLGGLGSPYLPWSMVSCDEEPGRNIHFRDVITYKQKWVDVNTKHLAPYRDDDNLWKANEQWNGDQNPHAIQSQFWGERVLKYFRSLGYVNRLHTPEPVRFWAFHSLDAQWLNQAAMFPPLHDLIKNGEVVGDDFGGQGVIVYGRPGDNFTTMGDPANFAHEFTHGLLADTVFWPTVIPESLDARSIGEGLGTCFAMLAIARQLSVPEPDKKLDMKYLNLGEEAPFHLGAGTYVQTIPATKGNPNLDDPKNSVSAGATQLNFRAWAGDAGTEEHENSTLLSGPCKLLITGGKNPHYAHVVVPGKEEEVSLGYVAPNVNRELAYDRLEHLLYTTIDKQMFGKMPSFEMLRNALVSTAETSWGVEMGERVWRAFGAYGFGRDVETEPNSESIIHSLGSDAAKNLVGVGKERPQKIDGDVQGTVDGEDTFILNEKLYGQWDPANSDTFSFEAKSSPKPLDVRVYRDQPCTTAEDDDAVNWCARYYQLWPVPDEKGKWSGPVQSTEGQWVPVVKPPGGIDPGTEPPGWHRIFIVVRPCTESGCTLTNHALDVKVKHKSSFY